MTRDEEEVIKAHDIVAQLLLDPEALSLIEPNLLRRLELVAIAEALCWILRHDHNTKFAGILVDVEKALDRLGIVMVRADRLFTLAGGKRAD